MLSQGFKRIRHYGLLASCHKREKLAACRRALYAPEPVKAVIEAADAFMQRVARIDTTRCAAGVMQVIETIASKRSIRPPITGPSP